MLTFRALALRRLIIPIYCVSIPHRRSTSFFRNYSHYMGIFESLWRFQLLSIKRSVVWNVIPGCDELNNTTLIKGGPPSLQSTQTSTALSFLKFSTKTHKTHLHKTRDVNSVVDMENAMWLLFTFALVHFANSISIILLCSRGGFTNRSRYSKKWRRCVVDRLCCSIDWYFRLTRSPK